MFAGKEVRVLLKGQAQESFLTLKKRDDKEAQTILHSIERIINILKTNPQYGSPIAKNLIPWHFKEQGITNLYHVELSHFWRMLYTLEGNRVEIFAFIV